MISLVFAYRSTKKEADLRLFCRAESFACYIPTKIRVEKEFWNKHKDGVQFKGDNLETSNYITSETTALKKHIQSKIDKAAPSTISKDWLKKVVHEYYNPPQPANVEVIPHMLIGYWDYYLRLRRNEVSKGYKKLFGTVKEKLKRFEQFKTKPTEIKDVDDSFKADFIEYCKANNYSQSTIRKDLKTIKTVCRHAKTKGVEVSPELDNLKAKNGKTPKIYLSFDELEKIKAVGGLTDYLDNARDWLLISCYTGQRVSDFMRFNKSMVRHTNGKAFLDLKQVKTGKDITVPLMPEVLGILDKRGGEFPRPISDQRYNEWIKIVCKKAGFTKKIQGRIATNVNPDPKGKSVIRNVSGKYEKWKLVTSHIGRRSFATNYYGKLPTTYLKNITGHGSEAQLLQYIGKTSKDTAVEAYEQMMKVK